MNPRSAELNMYFVDIKLLFDDILRHPGLGAICLGSRAQDL